MSDPSPSPTQLEPNPQARYHQLDSRWEKIAIFSFGVIFVLIILIVAIFLPEPSDFQYTIIRIILALAAAGVAALIPGFIEIEYKPFVRAGGALAVFAVVYFFSPAALVTSAKAQLSRLVEDRQKGEMFKTIGSERAFWLEFTDRRDNIVRMQNCIKIKTCDSSELQAYISEQVKSSGDKGDQMERVSAITDFYVNIARQAKSGTIRVYDACVCFGREIEEWQRSYLVLIRDISAVNGVDVDYQKELADFAFGKCTVDMFDKPCRG